MSNKTPGLAWLTGLAVFVTYEWWAIRTHHYTLSAWVWWADATFPWFQWAVLLSVAILMYHFFWQKRRG